MKLMFVPGLLCDEILWKSVIEALDSRFDCQTVMVTNEVSIEAMAERLAEEAKEPCHCIGFSLGAWVVLQFARQLPQQLQSMTLICSTAASLKPKSRESMKSLILNLNDENFEGYIDSLYQQYVSTRFWNNSHFKATLQQMQISQGVTTALQQLQSLLNYEGSLFLKDLKKIDIPTLVMQAEEDTRVDVDEIKYLSKNIPNSKHVLIPNSGHFAPIENPLFIAEALKSFLLTL